MKKLFVTLLLSFGIILTTNNIASPEVYTYKVYDKRINKSYNAEIRLTPLRSGGKVFDIVLEFYSKGDEVPLCFIDLDSISKNQQGLVQGTCYDSNYLRYAKKTAGASFDNIPKLNWRETVPNTFLRECKDIQEEIESTKDSF